MDKTYKFTMAELIKAFDLWNKDFLNDHEDFEKEVTLESGKSQAELLIEYLEK
jgi:hypothetical protein